ncbi:hypothetical protein HDU76_006935 [Blyttiomyces sp. JEL0837]|nr:hypothetical protein HDU76_006935 [Blyttiomyces sp. JEL0837]
MYNAITRPQSGGTPLSRSKRQSENKSNNSTSDESDSSISSAWGKLSDSQVSHIIHIQSTRNNTIVTLTTNEGGKTLAWASAGTCGLKKSARGSTDAGYQAVIKMASNASNKNVIVPSEGCGVEVRMKGFGPGREMGFRAVRALGWSIVRISDVTPIRHGGCRPRKKRRL